MFEKGRGNDHKELLVIYSADTIRLGSCYCCNNLRQKSTACCTFLLTFLFWAIGYAIFLSCIQVLLFTSVHLHTQYQKLYGIIGNGLTEKLGEYSWTGRHKIRSFWYWYCACISCHEYTEVRPSPRKETMKTLTFKCLHMTCISMRFFFFFISSLFHP